MTQAAVAVKEEQRVARPLRVLIPLIQDDLKNGREAAERAGMPHYRAAGEKLIEAKSQFVDQDGKWKRHGEWYDWLKRNFTLSRQTADLYIKLAEETRGQNANALAFSTLGDFIRKTSTTESGKNYNTFASRKPAWVDPVREAASRVDVETLNLKREELKRQEEREAQRQLALQLIDIGYKVLARTLHPDKGGSREAMSRLNAVRERLKQSA